MCLENNQDQQLAASFKDIEAGGWMVDKQSYARGFFFFVFFKGGDVDMGGGGGRHKSFIYY